MSQNSLFLPFGGGRFAPLASGQKRHFGQGANAHIVRLKYNPALTGGVLLLPLKLFRGDCISKAVQEGHCLVIMVKQLLDFADVKILPILCNSVYFPGTVASDIKLVYAVGFGGSLNILVDCLPCAMSLSIKSMLPDPELACMCDQLLS